MLMCPAHLGRPGGAPFTAIGQLVHLAPVGYTYCMGRQRVQALPNASLVVFEDTGHIPTLTRPLEVAAQIERFLANQA